MMDITLDHEALDDPVPNGNFHKHVRGVETIIREVLSALQAAKSMKQLAYRNVLPKASAT